MELRPQRAKPLRDGRGEPGRARVGRSGDGSRNGPRQRGNEADEDRNRLDPVAHENAKPVAKVQADLWRIADGVSNGHAKRAVALELHATAMPDLAGMPGMHHELARALAGLHAAQAARIAHRSQPEGERHQQGALNGDTEDPSQDPSPAGHGGSLRALSSGVYPRVRVIPTSSPSKSLSARALASPPATDSAFPVALLERLRPWCERLRSGRGRAVLR
jgi:hypothetical protein